MPDEPAPSTPDALLRSAAAADAVHAQELLARVGASRLLDVLIGQVELASMDGEDRVAGIDAIADLERAAVEVMDLPQDLELDLDEDDDPAAPPTLTGWSLVSAPAPELAAATLALPVRAWYLALVAFWDSSTEGGDVVRSMVAASADGRLARARSRPHPAARSSELLLATVTRDPSLLGPDGALATALLAALRAAARGG